MLKHQSNYFPIPACGRSGRQNVKYIPLGMSSMSDEEFLRPDDDVPNAKVNAQPLTRDHLNGLENLELFRNSSSVRVFKKAMIDFFS